MTGRICRHILTKWLGYKTVVDQPHPDKYIIALAPHTSNWDFIIAMLFGKANGMECQFMMKKFWFMWPLGYLMKALGGIPITREKHSNLTDKLATMARNSDTFHLCITPEGTRKATSEWRRGFYYIALKADLPILLYKLDYATKTISCTKTVKPTGDYEGQIKEIKEYYQDCKGKHPNRFILYTLAFLFSFFDTASQAQDITDTLYTHPTAPLATQMDWGKKEYRGNPWVQNTSLPYTPTRGLQGRHLSICASHGRYYDVSTGQYLWQRPTIFSTAEDIFTQTFAVPFLYPMLERAGAIVWTPRERCWMKEEVIVDNDDPERHGTYGEFTGNNEWQDSPTGFAWKREVYLDHQNPHTEGTARIVQTQTGKRKVSSAEWKPVFPRDGEYAVYVSYPSLSTNVPDARYTIIHKGIQTHVRVNQQMGGGTWVYLGTYDFGAGQSADNLIRLTNQSSYRGTVAADAVRLGGGMGNVARADSTGRNPKLSGLPRYLEAARYSQLWNGMPYKVYSNFKGHNDYNDDILTRPLATNHLAKGSIYLPGDSGLNVPIEMSLALHSDAGFTNDMSYVGSLTLHTSDFEEGLYPSGLSRMTASLLTSKLNEQLANDLTNLYGKWTVRGTWDKNYGETRVPRVPGVILEMLSHQNLADLRMGHDPEFKFNFSRAVYKAILRYTAQMHHITEVTVQPLPVHAFSALADPINHCIQLNWLPTDDPLEPTAKASYYIVYQQEGDKGWDNGTRTNEPSLAIKARPDVLYSFRVEAVNEGGASMPSEVLCARLSSLPSAKSMLIVNAFTRTAAPYSFVGDSLQGFKLNVDPGVAYQHTPAFCGQQRYFGKEAVAGNKNKSLGYSSSELIGVLVKGNTFDYPTQHSRDFAEGAFPLNISSSSRAAVENGLVKPAAFRMLDLILGAQRSDEYSTRKHKTLTPEWQSLLRDYTQRGGALLISGAYISTDLSSQEEKVFTERVLHGVAGGKEYADSLSTIEGMNTRCTYCTYPNERHLSTPYTSILDPTGTAFSIMLYPSSNHSAAIAYKGADYRAITLGFPIEQIEENEVRKTLMKAFLKFLLE